jgi:outer membrane protein assembly factor BamB
MARRMSLRAAAALLVLMTGCGREETAEWPQFRGPSGLGVVETGPLPTAWSADSANIRWRSPVPGQGHSSPIVAGGRVFLTTAIELPGSAGAGEKAHLERALVALDLATGKSLWKTEIFTGPRTKGHRFNTTAAPTPVTDGESVYVYFGSHLARVTFDGKVLWTKQLEPNYALFSHYGAASSPVLAGDAVIVVQDKEDPHDEDTGWMAAFDRDTGDEIWRQQWTNTCCSYSTPLLWTRTGADEELLFAYSGALVAHDPKTGERLWEHLYPMWQFVGGLVAEGDILCALGGAHNQRGNLCVRVTGPSRSAKVERLWFEPRRAPETSSPVLYRGRIYGVTLNGILSCYDLKTGKLQWAHDLEKGRGFRASIIAGDGKVYVKPTWGSTAVVDASTDAFRVLAWNDLGEGDNNATPAVGGGCLLLRTAEHLFCIEGSPASSS